ncbi:uroporphyrinogen-III synthase [Sphingomonas sp. A2-49]|uniref:uroporphyrinogen-III synthase n=1 Tax=Sphingomonas sp. A2-49 TaxID=1391375 RepID=UPI0021CFBFF5|nr:uroporphyrinogen-III synthase [Sphingomonas sp. A2-49]MCU6454483.1 uroporphyrinogen-III synthase [Sphingomonas sp. A2-49]
MRPLLVVRPEPGQARTVARLRAGGGTVVGWPLFVAAPVDWVAPDPDAHDALLVTSANAIRLAGAGLATLAMLPVIAVGGETAAVARAAGLRVAAVGDAGVAAALAAGRAAGLARPLHLAGREHVDSGQPTLVVYASADVATDPAAFAAAAAGHVVLLHSVRAARRVATLIPDHRAATALAALSPAVAAAAGTGWAEVAVAGTPTDAMLCACALERAIDRAPGGGDKSV